MDAVRNVIKSLEKQEDLTFKALFLVGAFWPLLSLILLSVYYLTVECESKTKREDFDKAISVWFYFAASSFVLTILFSIETSRSLLSLETIESQSLFVMNALGMSFKILYYTKLTLIILNLITIYKYKTLFIPLPKPLIIQCSNILDLFALKFETQIKNKNEDN